MSSLALFRRHFCSFSRGCPLPDSIGYVSFLFKVSVVCFYCFYKYGVGEREKSKDNGEHVASRLERDGNTVQRERIQAPRSITEPCTEAWTVIILSFILGPSRFCLQEQWEIDYLKNVFNSRSAKYLPKILSHK